MNVISKYLMLYISSFTMMIYGQSFFDNKDEVLSPQKAFQINIINNGDSFHIKWNIKQGYYMYLDSYRIMQKDQSISFELVDTTIIAYEDEFFGDTEIIRENALISINTVDISSNEELVISYQGCADQGFCYPIQKYKASLKNL
tara:strand:+ start:4739 stop:5170 length:432 start_codon:yes stop_codon:yes gene_type:complete